MENEFGTKMSSPPLLVQGSSGSAVKKLQQALNDKTILPPGESMLVADGKYGAKTASRVKLYQIQNKLKSTGELDIITASKLGISVNDVKASKPISVTSSGVPTIIPELEQTESFFEKHKRNIMLVGGGLAVVLVISLITRMSGSEKSEPVVKNNPGKKKLKSLNKKHK